jgi:hypothetical protein
MEQKDLADVLTELSHRKSTGVLSISVKSDNNQIKFFFRDGRVYHVTYSTCRNLECLARLVGLEVDQGFFLPGAKVDIPHQIALKTEDIIEQVRQLHKMVRCCETGAASNPSQATKSAPAYLNSSHLMRLEDEVLTLIGPVGAIVFERALAECGTKRGTSLPVKTFQALVHAIAREMPDDQRKALLVKFAF